MAIQFNRELPLINQWGPNAQNPAQQQANTLATIQSQLQQLQAAETTPGSLGFNNNIEDYWQPGVKEASQLYNQGLPELDPQGYLNSAMANVAGQNNPFMANLGQFNAANPYASELAGINTQNPLAPALAGVDTSNPFASQLGGMDTSNPYAALLGDYGSQANPYADELFNIGAENIRDQINSQFGMAGQGSGPGNFQEQLDQLSDYGAKFYGGIYDQQQNRLLDSLQSAGNLYGQGVGQGITATGQAGNLYGQGVGQNIGALGASGSLFGQGVGQQIGATGDAGNLFGQGMGQNLQALTAGSGLQNSMNLMPLTAFPSIMQLQQNQPWQGLQNYANVASQLTGTSPQQPESPGTSGWDKLVGLGTLALGAGSVFR